MKLDSNIRYIDLLFHIAPKQIAFPKLRRFDIHNLQGELEYLNFAYSLNRHTNFLQNTDFQINRLSGGFCIIY